MKLKVYEYSGCGTCKKAFKWLEENEIHFDKIPIREKPPTQDDLKKMLNFLDGDSKKLFNTSGKDYKDLNLKNRLPAMKIDEQIKLLASNGNLVKRPFIITDKFGLIGFKEDEWKNKLL